MPNNCYFDSLSGFAFYCPTTSRRVLVSSRRMSVRGVTSQPTESHLPWKNQSDQRSVNWPVEICANYAHTNISNNPHTFIVTYNWLSLLTSWRNNNYTVLHVIAWNSLFLTARILTAFVLLFLLFLLFLSNRVCLDSLLRIQFTQITPSTILCNCLGPIFCTSLCAILNGSKISALPCISACIGSTAFWIWLGPGWSNLVVFRARLNVPERATEAPVFVQCIPSFRPWQWSVQSTFSLKHEQQMVAQFPLHPQRTWMSSAGPKARAATSKSNQRAC